MVTRIAVAIFICMIISGCWFLVSYDQHLDIHPHTTIKKIHTPLFFPFPPRPQCVLYDYTPLFIETYFEKPPEISYQPLVSEDIKRILYKTPQ